MGTFSLVPTRVGKKNSVPKFPAGRRVFAELPEGDSGGLRCAAGCRLRQFGGRQAGLLNWGMGRREVANVDIAIRAHQPVPMRGNRAVSFKRSASAGTRTSRHTANCSAVSGVVFCAGYCRSPRRLQRGDPGTRYSGGSHPRGRRRPRQSRASDYRIRSASPPDLQLRLRDVPRQGWKRGERD